MTKPIRRRGVRASYVSHAADAAHKVSGLVKSLLGQRARAQYESSSAWSILNPFSGVNVDRVIPAVAGARFEALEQRQLLSGAAYQNFYQNVLWAGPGAGTLDHNYSITLSSDGKSIIATTDGKTHTYPASQVHSIKLIGGTVGDTIKVDPRITVPTLVDGGGAGNDSISGSGGSNTLLGGTGSDTIVGHGTTDLIEGRDGNDSLVAGNGTDSVYGGNGNDSIQAGTGFDYIDGQAGSNSVIGGTSKDVILNTNNNTGPADATYTVTPLKAVITTTTPTSIIAGEAVHVQGLSSGLGVGTPLTTRFHWNFGDSTSGSEYNDLDGFNAAHIYNNPGTYTVTLSITNQNGQTTTTTQQINVASDNRRTIYVAANGNDANNGLSPNSPIKSVGRANQLLGSNTKVLFRAGDTFYTSTTLEVAGYHDVLVGSYGSGNRPVLMYNGVRTYTNIIGLDFGTYNVTVSGLTFDSIFNTDTNETNMPYAMRAVGTNIAVRNCTFLNLGYAIDGSRQPTGFLLQDSSAPSATALRGYLVWAQGSDYVLLGNFAANSTREHIVRIGGATRLNISYNNFTNLNRQAEGDSQDIAKGSIVVQKGSYAYVAHNTVTDGPIGVGPLAGNTTDALNDKSAAWDWAVIDGNTVSRSNIEFVPGGEHVMVRNNIVHSDDGAGIIVDGENATYNRIVNDASILGNTIINNGTYGNAIWIEGVATGLRMDDNLMVAPNYQTGSNQAAPVYVSATDLSDFLEIKHNVWANAKTMMWNPGGENYMATWWASPTGYKSAQQWDSLTPVQGDVFSNVSIGSNSAPSSTSVAAHGGVSAIGLFDDFNGHIRPGSGVSAGAVQD